MPTPKRLLYQGADGPASWWLIILSWPFMRDIIIFSSLTYMCTYSLNVSTKAQTTLNFSETLHLEKRSQNLNLAFYFAYATWPSYDPNVLGLDTVEKFVQGEKKLISDNLLCTQVFLIIFTYLSEDLSAVRLLLTRVVHGNRTIKGVLPCIKWGSSDYCYMLKVMK